MVYVDITLCGDTESPKLVAEVACESCGRRLMGDENFCPGCGRKLAARMKVISKRKMLDLLNKE